jgi:hypothetical protein
VASIGLGAASAFRITPDQFQRLEELYDVVAELSPAERSRFLDEQCGGDKVLRR